MIFGRRRYARNSRHDKDTPTSPGRRLVLEQLERRELLSASPLAGLLATPAAIYQPAQIQTGYRFNSIGFLQGANYDTAAGLGQTIGIVDAYDNPNIVSDLATFSAQWGLPQMNVGGPSFVQVNQNGGSTLPAANSGWGLETALDVEWVHAVAPAANIVLVEANSSYLSDLFTAVDQAVTQGAHVVSMSWGGGEFSSEGSYNYHFNVPGVSFVASAGDSGAHPEYPSVSPYVVSVGGTSLTLDSAGNYLGETTWNGGGGGSSAYLSRPSYQTNYFNSGGLKSVPSSVFNRGRRLTPDVSYDADPNTGVYVYDQTWYQVGGTSAGAPQWAGLIALADQSRGSTLSSTDVLTALYNKNSYAADFHDVRTGSNGYAAGRGYDLATGLGSPQADQIVGALTGGTTTHSVVRATSGATGATSAAAPKATVTTTPTSSTLAPLAVAAASGSPATPLFVNTMNNLVIAAPAAPQAPGNVPAVTVTLLPAAQPSGVAERSDVEGNGPSTPTPNDAPADAPPTTAPPSEAPRLPAPLPDDDLPYQAGVDGPVLNSLVGQGVGPVDGNPSVSSDLALAEVGARADRPEVAAALAILLGGSWGALTQQPEEQTDRKLVRVR
jgi:hypothetical protein